MLRRLTIVIEFEQSDKHNWIWDRHNWKTLGCDLISLSKGDKVKRIDEFLNGLDGVLENDHYDGLNEYIETFDWYPEVTERMKK